MKQPRHVSVLLGGRSKERPGSLRSGEAAIDALQRLGHFPSAVDTNTLTDSVFEVLKRSDCAFLALHGRFGEDGKIQGLLELIGVPYTGCGVAASAIAMDKHHFKRFAKAESIPTPRFRRVDRADLQFEVERITQELEFPVVLKPVSEGGSLGISIVTDCDALAHAIVKQDPTYYPLIAEEFIRGTFLTVGLLGEYGSPDALPVLQVNHAGDIYDYDIKHTAGQAEYIIPARIPVKDYNLAQEFAAKIYLALGCHGPLRVDFMYSTSGELFVLEANTTPGLSRSGNLATIAGAANISYDALIDRILASAFNRPGYLP